MKRDTSIGQHLGRLLICGGCAEEIREDHVLLDCWPDTENKRTLRLCLDCALAVGGTARNLDAGQRASRLRQDRPWSEYPLGTLAHACTGGAWLRVAGGWQWNGHRPHPGSTFPTPGGDAVGACVEMPTALENGSR